VEVAHACEADAAAVLLYFDRTAAESSYLTFGPGELDITADQEAAFIRGLEQGKNGLMIKATVGAEIAALTIVTREPRPRLRHSGELGISVARQYWARGLGRAICQATMNAAKRVGVRRLALKVRADNARAIQLYESLGFAHEGRLVRSLRVGDEYFDDLAMAAWLG